MTGRAHPTPVDIIDPSLLQRVEATLMSSVASGVPWLDAASARLLCRPGKRLRPALVFAAAACADREDSASALNCAAAVEMLHQSSLIHDDLMDDAADRGGVASVHVTDGQAAAVLAGDYLLAAGGRLISQVSGEAAGIWHEAYAGMCEGQARETANRYSITTTDEYLLTIRGKTAALIRAACVLGGLSAGLDDRHLAALATFGESFGVLFQIVDDLMDVLSTPDLWGKTVQGDVAQGVFTLPVLLAAQAPGSPLPQLLTADLAPTSVHRTYEMVREFGVASTVATCYRWADRARTALEALAGSISRDNLAGLPERYATAVFTGRVAARHRQTVDPYLRSLR